MVRDFVSAQKPRTGTLIHVGDASVTKSGTWGTAYDVRAFEGSYQSSKTANDYVQFPYFGTSVWVRFKTDTESGLVEVFVDGVSKGSVDLYSLNPGYVFPIFGIKLGRGSHTVKLRVTGLNGGIATDSFVKVNGFIYDEEQGLAQVLSFAEETIYTGATIAPATYALIERDAEEGGGAIPTNWNKGFDTAPGGTVVSQVITPAVAQDVEVTVVYLTPTAGNTWQILRGGVLIASGAMAQDTFSIAKVKDTGVAGATTYNFKTVNAGTTVAWMFLVDHDMDEAHALATGATLTHFPFESLPAGTALVTVAITTAALGDVWCELVNYNQWTPNNQTMSLKRDGATIATFASNSSTINQFTFTDTNVPQGAHTYTVTSNATQATNALILVSNKG